MCLSLSAETSMPGRGVVNPVPAEPMRPSCCRAHPDCPRVCMTGSLLIRSGPAGWIVPPRPVACIGLRSTRPNLCWCSILCWGSLVNMAKTFMNAIALTEACGFANVCVPLFGKCRSDTSYTEYPVKCFQSPIYLLQVCKKASMTLQIFWSSTFYSLPLFQAHQSMQQI